MFENLEARIKGFREETRRNHNDMNCQMIRHGNDLREEVRQVRERWKEWDKIWKEEKDKVWGKLESIENRQRS